MMMMTAMEKKNDEFLKLVSVYLSFESKLRSAPPSATVFFGSRSMFE